MTMFRYGAISEIPTDRPTVQAFRIDGHIDDDASEALAKHMNGVFDRHDQVNMLLDFTGFSGSGWDSLFDDDVVKSRFRALSKVSRYAVIGAPDRAARMIGIMDKIIPVDARAFDADEAEAAWAFVDPQQKAA